MNKWDYIYQDIASKLATESKCAAKGVGCIVVKDQSIISSGVNGTPSGYVNCNEIYKRHDYTWYSIYGSGKPCPIDPEFKEVLPDQGDKTHKEFSLEKEIHAEVNALSKMNKLGISSTGATIYCTHSPCWSCAKNIVASGIVKVVYKIDFDDVDEVKDYLSHNGIELVRIDM